MGLALAGSKRQKGMSFLAMDLAVYAKSSSLNYRSFKAVAGCPPDSSSSRTTRQLTQRATPRSAQNWLRARCLDVITKDQWPPNSPNINPIDYHVWGAMLEALRKLKTKQKTSAELRETLQVIWGNLPQGPIDKAVKDFSRRLEAGVVGLAWSWRWTLRTFTVQLNSGI